MQVQKSLSYQPKLPVSSIPELGAAFSDGALTWPEIKRFNWITVSRAVRQSFLFTGNNLQFDTSSL